MFPSNTRHGGNYLIVCKAAIDDGHVATEQKVGRVYLWININPAKKGEHQVLTSGEWAVGCKMYGALFP